MSGCHVKRRKQDILILSPMNITPVDEIKLRIFIFSLGTDRD